MIRAACLVLPIAMALTSNAQSEMEHAQSLKSSLVGIDTHIDTVQRVYYGHVDLGQRLPDGQVDLVRLQEGGMHAPFFALWVPTYFKGAEAIRRTLDLRDAMQSVLDAHPDQIRVITSDRGLMQRAEATGATVEGSLAFRNRIDA